jgi:hypothetical protein
MSSRSDSSSYQGKKEWRRGLVFRGRRERRRWCRRVLVEGTSTNLGDRCWLRAKKVLLRCGCKGVLCEGVQLVGDRRKRRNKKISLISWYGCIADYMSPFITKVFYVSYILSFIIFSMASILIRIMFFIYYIFITLHHS